MSQSLEVIPTLRSHVAFEGRFNAPQLLDDDPVRSNGTTKTTKHCCCCIIIMSISSTSSPCCPHHGSRSDPSCSTCSACYQIELARKKLSLQQERLQLDRQLLKAEKKKHQRHTMMTSSNNPGNTDMEATVRELEEEAKEWQARLQKEQQDHVLSNIQARTELAKKEEKLQLTTSELSQLKEQLMKQQQEWKLKSNNPAGETSHEVAPKIVASMESDQNGAEYPLQQELDATRVELATVRQKLLDQLTLFNQLERRMEDYKTMSLMSLQAKEASMDVTVEQMEQKHYQDMEELKLQYEQQHNDVAALDQLQSTHAAALSELEESNDKLLQDHMSKYELEKASLQRQLNDTKQYLAMSIQGKQADCDTTLEKIQIEHMAALATLETRLEQQTEQSKIELEQQLQHDHSELLQQKDQVRILEDEFASRSIEQTTWTNELQDMVFKLTQRVEEERARSLEFEEVVLQRDDDLAILQDVNVMCDRYLQQVKELEQELIDTKKIHEQENITLQEQLEQQQTAATVTAAKRDARIVRFDDDIRAIHASQEKEVHQYQRQIRELEEESRKCKVAATAPAAMSTTTSVRDSAHAKEVHKLTSYILALEAKIKTLEREHGEALEELTKELTEKESSAEKAATGWENETLQDKVVDLQDQLDYFIQENEALIVASTKHEEELAKCNTFLDTMQRAQQEAQSKYDDEMKEMNAIQDRNAGASGRLFAHIPAIQDQVYRIEQQLDELTAVERNLLLAPPLSPTLSPPEDHTNDTQSPTIRRRPPLSCIDDQGNCRVTEVDYQGNKQSGKYTGWMDDQGRPNGHGIFRVDNGDVYEGEWKLGQRHGQGVYTWYEGDLYNGPWQEGKRHGHGVFVFSDGRIYDGYYVQGNRQGSGMFTWPYGAKYEGEYEKDRRNGAGMYVYADGRTYKGEYKDDRPHGYGTEYTKDGSVLYDGVWQFGEFVGDDNGSVSVA